MSEKLDLSDIHNIPPPNTQVFKAELFVRYYIPEVGIKGWM